MLIPVTSVAFLNLICPMCSARCSQPIVLTVFSLTSALACQIDRAAVEMGGTLLKSIDIDYFAS